MNGTGIMERLAYADRLAALRESKQLQTLEKQRVRGAMDFDDHAIILPPAEIRETVETLGGSGVYFTDVILNTFKPAPNHPSGGFFGPRSTGENFRRLLEAHPVYIDPTSSLAGAYMVNFMAYRTVVWNPDIDCSGLLAEHAKYQTIPAIGGVQHMCQDMEMGLKLGWGGILKKINRYRPHNPASEDFYSGLEHVVLGIQNLITRHAVAARAMATDDELMKHVVDSLRSGLKTPRAYHIVKIGEQLPGHRNTDPTDRTASIAAVCAHFQLLEKVTVTFDFPLADREMI